MQTAHVGFLWARFRDRYPNASEQIALDPVFETFGTPPRATQLRLESLTSPPFPRYWFESDDGEQLCQVQQDRLIHNWRRREGKPYPRYEVVRDRLIQDLGTFEDFVKSEGLGEIAFNQVEVTYVNTVELPDGTGAHGAMDQVLALWRAGSGPNRQFEDAALRARYLIQRSGLPQARLHVNAMPALRTATSDEVIRIDMTFRGKPDGDDQGAALALLDEGRAAIVRAFTDLTTPEMHKHWGRTDAS
jgi:uncharacterized protein (TIGR04255 family)